MANGYCPALLRHIDQIAETNSPTLKLHVAGFLKSLFLAQNSTVSPVNDGLQPNGHKKTLTVKYRKRPTSDVVTDTDDCEIDRIPAYSEWSLPSLLFRKTSFFITDEEIKKYCDEASRAASMGAGASTFMQEHFGVYLEHANILMKEINKALVSQMATQFGENITIGSDAGKVINIDINGQNLRLNDGIIELLNDLRENEMSDQTYMVGGGIMASYDAVRLAQGLTDKGVDASRLAFPQFFYDKASQTEWGQDAFAIFSRGSVKLLTYNKYVGGFAGAKGNSIFGTVPFPVQDFSQNPDAMLMAQVLRDLRLDFQMRYIDCPTEIDVAGTPTTVNRGWQIILSKEFGLWVQPKTAFDTGDELENTNGTLLYYATNVCKECDDSGAYAYGG
jgi:hypothetical protein